MGGRGWEGLGGGGRRKDGHMQSTKLKILQHSKL